MATKLAEIEKEKVQMSKMRIGFLLRQGDLFGKFMGPEAVVGFNAIWSLNSPSDFSR